MGELSNFGGKGLKKFSKMNEGSKLRLLITTKFNTSSDGNARELNVAKCKYEKRNLSLSPFRLSRLACRRELELRFEWN